ncbi:hypothetical protein U1Q18_038750, partial [Sarracenia purpurea var. burkii]
EFSEEDLQNLKKGHHEIFIKENLEETSTSQQPATAQSENAESAENSALPTEWRYAHGHPKDLILGDASQ